MEKYFQDFADKTAFVFNALFPRVVGGPPTPVEKNAQAFYQWGLENNYPAIGFYSAYPGLSVQHIRALLADRESPSGHRWLGLGVKAPRIGAAALAAPISVWGPSGAAPSSS